MRLNLSKFVDKWRQSAYEQIKRVRPELSDKKIYKHIDQAIDETLVNPPCQLDNNHIHKVAETNLLDLYDWINDTKPIIAGYGVFFKNQDKIDNPMAEMIMEFLNSRGELKHERDTYDPYSYEYGHFDMLQAGEKICANAIYGAGGAKTAIFYNLYTAASTTGTAQSLISTTTFAFEAFKANNVPFYDTDDILLFIDNICNEKTRFKTSEVKSVSRKKVLKYLISTAKHPEDVDRDIISRTLDNLTDEQVTRLYYKNNFYEFIKNCNSAIYLLQKIMIETKQFRVPNKKHMTGTLEIDLTALWKYFREFVLYNYPTYNRIYRLKKDVRKSVLTIDTDSNMLTIYKWNNFVYDNFIDDRVNNTYDEIKFISTSIICYLITEVSNEVLKKYCRLSNVLDRYSPRINMKNEYLYETFITTEVKKNYLASMLLKEGVAMNPPKLDIKGLSFTKTTLSPFVSKYFKDIVREDIMNAKEIDCTLITNKLDLLSEIIKTSLSKGETRFIKPMSVKDPDAYKMPFSEMGIRSVMGWNTVYPDNPIELPDNILAVKVNMGKLKDIRDLESTYPEIYERLMVEIYENDMKEISSKGLNSFAIPQIANEIPEWLIPYIDI